MAAILAGRDGCVYGLRDQSKSAFCCEGLTQTSQHREVGVKGLTPAGIWRPALRTRRRAMACSRPRSRLLCEIASSLKRIECGRRDSNPQSGEEADHKSAAYSSSATPALNRLER